MEEEQPPTPPIKVLITGFGPFLDIKLNPSSQIVSLLPSTLTLPSNPSQLITLITPPPLECSYHTLLTTTTALLEEENPDIVLHIGLDSERDYFAIEKGAPRDGYHEYPDISRKVFTRAESKKTWGKSPERLETAFDIDSVVEKWKVELASTGGKHVKWKGKGKQVTMDVRTSDDVGTYVCGFLYYASLEWCWKRKREEKVVFFHVPPLVEERDVKVGVEVTVALMRALVESHLEGQ